MSRIISRRLGGVVVLALLLLTIFSIPPQALSQEPPKERIVVPISDTRIQSSGHWQALDGVHNGYLSNSGLAGDDVIRLDFAGAYLELVYAVGPDLGTVAIEVDGQVVRTIESYAETAAQDQRSVINYLSIDAHVVHLYAVEGRIAVSALIVDALVPSTPTPQAQEIRNTDYWAIELEPGQDPQDLATRLGYKLERNIAGLPNIYLYSVPGTATRANLIASVNHALSVAPEVLWFEHQVARQQDKRPIPNDPGLANQWHLINTGQGGGTAGEDANVSGAWTLGYDGSGVLVGVVDDGIDRVHAELLPNYNAAASYDYNFGDSDPAHDLFEDGHGTAVAGVIAAIENQAAGSCGVGAAYGAQVAGLRLISEWATDTDEADAMANALASTPGAVMISSNSWGPLDDGARVEGPGPLTIASIENQIQNGRGGKGVIYVWAGGNGGTSDDAGADGYASSKYTISVAATTNTGVRSYYSEHGSAHLINAPSNGGTLGITTTDRTGVDGYSSGNCISNFGGTSSAAPLVSGIVALILEANPSLTWRDVQYILVETAEKNDPSHASWIINGAGHDYNPYYGFGRIDATAAVIAAENWDNVDAASVESSGTLTVGAAVPDNNTTGISRTYNVSNSDVGVLEHVEVVFTGTGRRGDYEIILTSPSGTVSTLIRNRNSDTYSGGFSAWKFMSVAFWGENPNGTWTITVKDRRSGGTGLNFSSWNLILNGLEVEDSTELLLPEGNVITTAPNFVWQYESLADWYRLNVRRQSDDSAVVDKWYQVNVGPLSCAGGTCTLTPDFEIGGTGSQALKWRLQSYAGGNTGPLTVNKNFTVLAATLNQPSGTQNLPLGNPVFSWAEVTDGANSSQWYALYVSKPSGSYQVWLKVGEDVTCSAGTCTAQPSALGIGYRLSTGVNTWYVRGFHSNLGFTPWSIGKSFTLTASVPPTINKTSPSPSQTITSLLYSFTWQANANAHSYQVYVSGPSGFSTTQNVVAAEACSSSCTYAISLPANGAYSWYVRGNNAAGGGSWGTATNFTANAPLPATVSKIAPTSSQTYGVVPFSWSVDSQASSYSLYIAGPSGWTSNQTWNSADICSSSCLVAVSLPHNGAYSWYVRGNNAAGSGGWGTATNFTVTVPTVPMISKNTPAQSSIINTNAILINWQHNSNASGYQVYLGGPSGYTYNQTLINGIDIICGATCSMTLYVPNNGTYNLYLRAVNPAGYGPWGPNDAGGDYGVRSFTVTAPAPSPANAQLVSPNGDVLANSSTVEFKWTASANTAWYGLVLKNATTGATLSTTWYSAETIGCQASASNCSITQTVAAGNYEWGVLAWSNVSSGMPPLNVVYSFTKLNP